MSNSSRPKILRNVSPFAVVLALASLGLGLPRAHASKAEQRLVTAAFDSLLREPGAMDDPDRIAAAFEVGQQSRLRGVVTMGPSSEVTTIPLDDLQRRLDKGELLVDWLCGAERTLVFTISRDERHVFSIAGPAALAEKIRPARQALESRANPGQSAKSAKTAGEDLARLLFGDALPLVAKARTLILAPDGPLGLVPMTALVVNGQPLVATRTTTLSLALSFTTEAPDAAEPGRAMLAVQGGAAEPQAERAIEWLAGTFQGVTLARADRSVPDSAALVGYEALHFAGRVTYDDEDPWKSGVDAGRRHAHSGDDPPRPGDDGLLRAEHVAGLRLGARVVVLANCAHSAANIGPETLAASFLAAGARAVIVPLWPMDDRDVESLMRELYRTLDTGQPIGDAFRQAQDHQRRTSGTQHPHYWAGWSLWGDGSAKIDLKPNPIWKRGTPSNLKH
jgi:hypothetical protein